MAEVVRRQTMTYGGTSAGIAACSDGYRNIYVRDWDGSEWYIRKYDTYLDTFTWIANNSSFTGFANFSDAQDIVQAGGPVFFNDEVYVMIYNQPSNIDRIGIAKYSGSGTTWTLVNDETTDNTSWSRLTGLFSDGTRLMAIYGSGTRSDVAGGWRVTHSTDGASWTDIAFTETTDVHTFFSGSYNTSPSLMNSWNNTYNISPQIIGQSWQNFAIPSQRSYRLFQWDGTTFDEIKEAHNATPAFPPVIDTGDVWVRDVDTFGTTYTWGVGSGTQYMENYDGSWNSTDDSNYTAVKQSGFELATGGSLLEVGYNTADGNNTFQADMSTAGAWTNKTNIYSVDDLDFWNAFKFTNGSEWFVVGKSSALTGVWALSTAQGDESEAAASTPPRFYYGINELVERVTLPFASGINWGAMALTTLDEIVVGTKTAGDAIMTTKMSQSDDFVTYEDITTGISTSYDIETIRNV